MKANDSVSATDGAVAQLRHVLVAFSDQHDRETLRCILVECGLRPMPCSTLKEAQALLTSHAIGLAFCEDHLADGDYTDLLYDVRSSARPIPVVVCAPQLDLSLYLDAMELGVYDFMVRPYRKADVAWIVEGALWKVGAKAVGAHN